MEAVDAVTPTSIMSGYAQHLQREASPGRHHRQGAANVHHDHPGTPKSREEGEEEEEEEEGARAGGRGAVALLCVMRVRARALAARMHKSIALCTHPGTDKLPAAVWRVELRLFIKEPYVGLASPEVR